MYRTKEATQKRKDEKRQTILDAAARVFAAKGYHNTVITDIVKAADVSVGSVYFYFKNKEELFFELYKGSVKQFNDVISSVLDVENFPLQKNFTRVMTATLWMYEQKRDIARILISETAAVTPTCKIGEEDRIKGFVQIMSEWFRRFKSHKEVYIPDERVAALAYVGTFGCLVNDYISSGEPGSLTNSAYAFCVYNLQALRIPFKEEEIRSYIEELLEKLEKETR